MKYLITSLVLFATVTIAFSGVTGFLSKETRGWNFIQAVGGMEVSVQGNNLMIDCDVSGLKKVTVEPTQVNSALGVRMVKHQRVGKIIQLSLLTSVLEKGITSSCKPIDVSAYPAGSYTVQYIDPDDTTYSLGKITLQETKKGEQVSVRHQAIARKPKSKDKKDADIKKQLNELDLSDVCNLTYSPNKAFIVGITDGPKSLVKVWDLKKKKLLHEFSVPGEAHAVACTPDSATLIVADATGNLAAATTIRAWSLANGKEREVGSCIGEIREFCVSPDGTRLAAVSRLSYFGAAASMEEAKGACVS